MQRRRSRRRFAAVPTIAFAAALSAGCSQTGDGLLSGAGSAAAADPDSLIGLAPQQIGETLGVPELQRREPPAEVWQYRTRTCVFDLYIYEEDGARQAVHYTARSRTNGAVRRRPVPGLHRRALSGRRGGGGRGGRPGAALIVVA